MAIDDSHSDDDYSETKQSTPPPNGSLLEFLRDRRSPMIEPKVAAIEAEAAARPASFRFDSHTRVSPSASQSMAAPAAERGAAPTPSAGSSSPDSTTAKAAHSVKRSRYLRESDRRNIIRRINRGEKQATLAKEFGVTRAAICHINKNRVEILLRSNRTDVHCEARHPKRGLYNVTPSHDQPNNNAMAARRESPMVFEVRSRPLHMMLTLLRNKDTISRDYRAAADRAFRMLLEEAIASVPAQAVAVTTPNGAVCQGLVADKPTCTIVMSECGYPLLETFRAIAPDSPTGFMTLQYEDQAEADMDGIPPVVRFRRMSAPPNLSRHNVLLLDAACATSNEAIVAIQALLDFGAHEDAIYFIALVFSAAAVAEICEQFPAVHIVTATIDPETTENEMICPGIGNFQERYFNTTTIRQTHLGANVFL